MLSRGRIEEAFCRRVGRRGFVQGLGAIAISGLTAGCRIGIGPRAQRAIGPSPVMANAARGGTLRVVTADGLGKPSFLRHPATWDSFLLEAVTDRLMRYRTDKLEMEPELAESWRFSQDFASLTVKLRSGVKFHNGRVLAAEDVRRCVSYVGDSVLRNYTIWIADLELPDASTLVFHFDQPRPCFLDLFELLPIFDTEISKTVVGTGPFAVKDWVTYVEYTLARNPDYWRKGLPYLDGVTAKVTIDRQTQLADIRGGTADLALDLDPRDVKSLAGDKSFAAVNAPVLNAAYYLGVDVKGPRLSDKRVRQALAYLVDRQHIVDGVLVSGEAGTLPWEKSSPAYDAAQAKKTGYDVDRAKQLLAQAGLSTGFSTTIVVSEDVVPYSVALAETLQADLARGGIRATVEKLSGADWTSQVLTGKAGGLWIGALAANVLSPQAFLFANALAKLPGVANLDVPDYVKLIDQALRESDEARLKKIYGQINDFWLEECFVLFLALAKRPLVFSSRLQGFAIDREGNPRVATLSLTQ